MTKTLHCISPVDGSTYAERKTLDAAEAQACADRARAAQPAWAARSLAERIAVVKAGVAKLDEMKDQLVEELAWQMGRPTRYGGEFGGVHDRTNYMAGIAAETLAPMVVEDSAGFKRQIAREPVGVVFIVAPWNYPYLTAVNSVIPALMAGNAVVQKADNQTKLRGIGRHAEVHC